MKTFKYLIGAVLIGAVAFQSQITHAKSPSETSIKKLIAVTKTEEAFRGGFVSSFLTNLNMVIVENFRENNPHADEKQLAQLQKVAETYSNTIANDIANDATLQNMMIDEMVKTIKNHYTQEEVNAIIKFYGSPIGQRIIDKQMSMTQELASNKELFYLIESHMTNYMNSYKGEQANKKLQEELQRISGQSSK